MKKMHETGTYLLKKTTYAIEKKNHKTSKFRILLTLLW